MQKYLTEVKFMTLNRLRHPLWNTVQHCVHSRLDKGAQER